ncbi:hypothetical protein ABIE41_001479 [Bosea sp. OAE506]|uniref:tail fiber domain-containing protein n=1 Tax=Bosea sp. OAE506 TaxID=2663870 RepID=UPI00178BB586
MGKSTPEAPPSPDPYATARAQTSSNVSTAVANTVLGNADETGPLGNVRYQQKGSYKLSEPVLDRDGRPVTTKRWVPDAGGNAAAPVRLPGAILNEETGARLTDGEMGPAVGGNWVEEAQMTDREIPQWERIVTLSPEEQAKYDKQNVVQQNLLDLAGSQSKRLQDTLGQPLNYDGLPDAVNSVDLQYGATDFADVTGPQRYLPTQDYSADRQKVEQALYARLNPQLEQDRAALENQLVNQGFTRGSEAFRNELDSANRQSNDARLGVILAGGQEQSRLQGLDQARFQLENAAQNQEFAQAQARGLYGLGAINQNNQTRLTGAQFQNTARERALQERMALRNSPINEISALLGQSQVSMPQFSPFQAGTIAGTPVGDYVYRSADIDQKNYQAQMQANAASNGGLFSLGSAALGGMFNGGTGGFAKSAIGGLFSLSDRRAKTAIRPAGALRNGLPLYVFRYLGEDEEQLGVMAQDVEAVLPHAVAEREGVKFVNYSEIYAPLPDLIAA